MRPPVEVAKPCTADWGAMTGDDRKRLCAQCDKHVHNLSALTRGELAQWVAGRDGTECIGYEVRTDGTMITAPRFKWFARALSPLRWVLGLMLPFLFANCARRTVGGPMRPPPEKSKQLRQSQDGMMLLGEVCPPESKKPAPSKH